MDRYIFPLFLIIGLIYGIIDNVIIPHQNDFLIYYHTPIETLSYIAVITSTGFIAYQIRLFIEDYDNKNQRAEQEYTYEMARYYAERLIPKFRPIKIYLDKTNNSIPIGNKDWLKNLQEQELQFTAAEANSIIQEGITKDFLATMQNNIPKNDLLTFFADITHKTTYEIDNEWKALLRRATDEDETRFYREKANQLRREIFNAYNELEYLAMVYCSKLAIPETVYVSLHQSYLDLATTGYLFIASRNNNPGHEYFTHIRSLRNRWLRQAKQEQKNRSVSTDPSKTHFDGASEEVTEVS